MGYKRTGVQGALDESTEQLHQLIHQRDQLHVQIIKLQEQIRSLRSVALREQLTQEQDAIVGISDAIRSILRLKNVPMTAADVKADLEMMGYNFAGLANPSALVHNTLKRMIGMYEVSYDPRSKTYQALPLNFVPMNTPARR